MEKQQKSKYIIIEGTPLSMKYVTVIGPQGSHGGIMIGSILVSEWSYYGAAARGSKMKYTAYSRLQVKGIDSGLFETEDEAKKHAIQIAIDVAKLLCTEKSETR